MFERRLARVTDVENIEAVARETYFQTIPEDSYYKAVTMLIRDIAGEKRKRFLAHNLAAGKKQVYYLSMEFLLGRSLKTTLFNLGAAEDIEAILKPYGVTLDALYEFEPDAGLGNGGLGRLAACYLDALAHEGYLATGYCILYEFGMFRQKIVDGWQSEVADDWLPGGEIWLTPQPGRTVEVRFGGKIEESWTDGYHLVNHTGYTAVLAVPYDINITGYNSEGVSLLRAWRAKTPMGMDMESFNRGDYASAFYQSSIGEAISKVLYPNDNHIDGKMLRLRQQYFLCSAAIADICRRHLAVYGSLANFHEKNAIHINDTHPTLAIPELMRFLLDDCGYGWDISWDITKRAFAYTNHTVMREALETWEEGMLRTLLPRIHMIICEINRRFCQELYEQKFLNQDAITRMSIIGEHIVRMANLAVAGSHSINGVSALHSDIIKRETFNDFYEVYPDRFTNVTNGIASRRWLLGSNPGLTELIEECIGEDFADDMQKLSDLNRFLDDASVLERIEQSKRQNKERFARHVQRCYDITIDPDSIFDVHVKRLHEYKRQQMNALDIIATMQYLRDNPGADFVPRTYIFGAKAAPGYYMAKQIIKLICTLSDQIEKDPLLRKHIRVVFLEEYNVTTSELLMPASDISQQISLAGTEASGTGNMKLMLNGAITLGTLDGANVEILQMVGDENIRIFGMTAEEVAERRTQGYHPQNIYDKNPVIKRAVSSLIQDVFVQPFPDIYKMLTGTDYYMTLADFDSYRSTRDALAQDYRDRRLWNRMSLRNTAQSGFFCADRAVQDYARDIWGLWK